MKKISFLAVATAIMLTLNACSGEVNTSDLSENLKAEYEFYEDSIGTIKSTMGLSQEEADSVFTILVTECGVDEKTQYVFKGNGDNVYTVWAGLLQLEVTLKDNAVDTVMQGTEQIYPQTEQADSESIEEGNAALTQPTTIEEKEPQGTEDIIKAVIEDVVGADNLEAFNYVPDNNFSLIKFKGRANLTNAMTVKGMWLDIFNILKDIQSEIDTDIDFNIVYPLTDTYGNTEEVIVIKATFTNETIKKINFENAIFENIPVMADEWWNHNALDEEG